MRAKLLGIVLTTPIAISSFASTETLSFTPDNINADISLGTLSGKTKETLPMPIRGTFPQVIVKRQRSRKVTI